MDNASKAEVVRYILNENGGNVNARFKAKVCDRFGLAPYEVQAIIDEIDDSEW